MATKQEIHIPGIQIRVLQLTLVGDSPLIVHRWSEKAKQQMLDKQMKKARQAKQAKDPEQDYEESLYPFESDHGKYGFPSVGIKAAAVGAGRYTDSKMTELRGMFHVLGELTAIEGVPQPREDMVRVGMGTADIRYRAEFPEWRAFPTVRFNERAVSTEQVVNLFNIAGFAIGIGEWRPERDGSYGMFHVEVGE